MEPIEDKDGASRERVRVAIPYGSSSLEAEVLGLQMLFTGEPRHLPAINDFEETLIARLERPTASRPLREIAKGRTNALILVEDITRDTPVHRILPVLFDYLNSAGLTDECIEILMAPGTHRVMTDEELLTKVGEEAHRRVKITQHDCLDMGSIVDLGFVQAGHMRIPVHVNRKVLGADLIIGLGDIVPHPEAGFSAGAKIVQPGVCGLATTATTHIAAALLDEIPMGDVDNPCRLGMEEVARRVGLDFIVNVVQDPDGRMLEVVAGDFVAAHRLGAGISRQAYGIPVPKPADIVIVSSFPHDIDWWQALKGPIAAYFAVKKGGCIVFVTPCPEGLAHNHPRLREWLQLSYRDACSRASSIDPANTAEDLVAAEASIVNARIREKATILVVSPGLSDADIAVLGYRRMPDLQTAVDCAMSLVPGKTLGVLPHGGVCLPIVASQPSVAIVAQEASGL